MSKPIIMLIKFDGKVDCFDQLIPDLSFGYLTSCLKQANIPFIFYDLSIWKSSEKELFSLIQQSRPLIIGFKIQNIGTGISEVLDLAKKIKKKWHAKLIAGGPVIRLFEDSCYNINEFKIFDVLCYGEGCETIINLYQAYKEGESIYEIPNLLYRKNGKIIKTKWKLEDFKNISPVEWDAFELQNYLPIIPINFKRGCEHLCSFCSHPHIWGRKVPSEEIKLSNYKDLIRLNSVRVRKWENIKIEIEQTYNKYNIKIFYIVDSTPDKKLLKKFANYIIEEEKNIKWCAFARFGMFDKETLELFKKSGLKALWFGWESGDNNMLKLMRKKLNVDNIRDTYKNVEKQNIFAAGSFIVAHPGETFDSIKSTFSMIKDLDYKYYSISPFRLMAGSYISYIPSDFNIELLPNWKERVLKAYIEGLSEFDIKYYKINDMSNIKWWNQFKNLSDYKNWYDSRIRDNCEISYLIASHTKVDHNMLIEKFLEIFKKKDQFQLENLLHKIWKANYK